MLEAIQEIQRLALKSLSDGVHPFTLNSFEISFDEKAAVIAEVRATDGKGREVAASVFADGQIDINEIPF